LKTSWYADDNIISRAGGVVSLAEHFLANIGTYINPRTTPKQMNKQTTKNSSKTGKERRGQE
jgi:hypothetical protein